MAQLPQRCTRLRYADGLTHLDEFAAAFPRHLRVESPRSKAGHPIALELPTNRGGLFIPAAKNLLYQEVIGEACASLAAVPRSDAETERLLVGGRGHVWEYGVKKQRPDSDGG